jgi:hypothetical protein
MWQLVQLTDVAELQFRSGKERTRYSSLFKGKWIGDTPNQYQLCTFHKKKTPNGQWEIMV